MSINIETVKIFGNDIRTMELYNEVLFVGPDSAKACGYRNSSQALITHVNPRDILVMRVPDRRGTLRRTKMITKQGLASLARVPMHRLYLESSDVSDTSYLSYSSDTSDVSQSTTSQNGIVPNGTVPIDTVPSYQVLEERVSRIEAALRSLNFN